jgi:hypothetical protein
VITVAPIARDQLPEGWIEERREVIQREGYALRAGEGATIEIKSLTTNEWLRLALLDKATAFTTEAERDVVLELLTGEI